MSIAARLPADMPDAERAALAGSELRRGRELLDAGLIKRIWRVPGRQANVGVWDAPDADALHEAITSLPMSRWFEVDVVPLARHPLERE